MRPLFILLFLSISSFLFGQTLNTPIIKEKKYGEKFDRCPNSPNNFYVIYKNVNPFPIDLVIAIKDSTGEWKIHEKYNIAGGDTMLAYTCNGAGKVDLDFRKSGVKIPLKGYDDFNEDYLKDHPKPLLEQAKDLIDFKAKLLFGEKVKKPIVNQKVDLKDNEGKILHSTTTNEFGDFSFEKINPKQPMELSLENNPALKSEKVYIAKTNGAIITEMKKDASGAFVYKMLPAEFKKLSTVEVEDDPFVVMKDFSKSGNKDLIIADNVYFEAGSSELLPEAKVKLDKVAAILKENSTMRAELSAHTDSKGDDASNLKLSETRAKLAVEYIVSKGIDSKRISGKGFGETKLLNRCTNGVNCSEEEHRLNRRVEFKFIKN